MITELPESAAHVATDPKRVYHLGAGCNPCLLPGLHFSNEAPPQTAPFSETAHDMLDGLRQGLLDLDLDWSVFKYRRSVFLTRFR